jgi:hypothetical protein
MVPATAASSEKLSVDTSTVSLPALLECSRAFSCSQCTLYGVWCRVTGVWCKVQSVWRMVCGVWCVVQGEECRVKSVWCMVYGAKATAAQNEKLSVQTSVSLPALFRARFYGF